MGKPRKQKKEEGDAMEEKQEEVVAEKAETQETNGAAAGATLPDSNNASSQDEQPKGKRGKAAAAKRKKPEAKEKVQENEDDEEEAEEEATQPKKKARTAKAKAPKTMPPSSFPKIPPAEDAHLRIMAYNVNGFRACQKKDFEKWLLKESPDICCISETKCTLQEAKLSKDVTSAYQVHWNPGNGAKKGYAGTGVFVKPAHAPLSVKLGLGDGVDDEGRTITLEFPKFYLVASYVPNSGQNLERLTYRTKTWDPALCDYIVGLEKTKPVIWTGDLNVARLEIDIHDPVSNKNKSPGFTDAERSNFDQYLTKHNFVDVFRHFHPDEKASCFTYWSYRFNMKDKNKGWRLDYFLCSKPLLPSIKATYIAGDVRMSDHAPIILDVKLE